MATMSAEEKKLLRHRKNRGDQIRNSFRHRRVANMDTNAALGLAEKKELPHKGRV